MQSRFDTLLADSPQPQEAARFLGRMRREQPAVLERLASLPVGPLALLTLFGHSRFLAEEVLRYPEWLEDCLGGDLHRPCAHPDYEARLEAMLGLPPDQLPDALMLARFRRRELVRICLRDALRYASLAEVTGELSSLADAVLDVTYRRIRRHLIARHGQPWWIDESGGRRECGMSVVALGKLGGEELNYSSDIDLMFLYSGNGETDGPEPVPNKLFFKKAANLYTALLSTYTAEGLCYRVDLRLRPDGRTGEVCLSVDGARHYYQTRARDWELQMLIKARVAAGERQPGAALLDAVEPLIYSSSLDFTAVEAVSEARQRIHEKQANRRRGDGQVDVKLAKGGIRDVEFLAQCLQRLHGGRDPWVRHGGTLLALSRLHDKGYLSTGEYSRLVAAYEFLRHLEHRLQLVDDRQTHTLPTASPELDSLARRMPREAGETPSATAMLERLRDHLHTVQAIYERVIHAQQEMYYSPATAPSRPEPVPLSDLPPSSVVRHLDQQAPGLAATVATGALRRGYRDFERFLERLAATPALLRRLESEPGLRSCVLDLFEHSPYLGGRLIRSPEELEPLSRVAQDGQPVPDYAAAMARLDDPDALRLCYQTEAFLLHAASVFRAVPIFDTLGRSSELADAAVATAYRMAVAHARALHPPEPGYDPADRMMVVALGRLGMREFDLASDADLVFALPDEDRAHLGFWTRVAERLIQILSAYTGNGTIFTVDTRLRPNGREGPLVQTVSAFLSYFARGAEAWEGIAYMKARAVAGTMEGATAFLNELQQVDWRRYGQSGRSRQDLRQMRLRLEREQGVEHELKSGAGGYYDVDFALMYLRLKGAGLFFKVLNTPERIDIVEKMGHLERADAEFLRVAASFYRAVDHGLRVYSGHSEGSLPSSGPQLDAVTALVRRWTPATEHRQPLAVELAEVRRRTREFFERLFH